MDGIFESIKSSIAHYLDHLADYLINSYESCFDLLVNARSSLFAFKCVKTAMSQIANTIKQIVIAKSKDSAFNTSFIKATTCSIISTYSTLDVHKDLNELLPGSGIESSHLTIICHLSTNLALALHQKFDMLFSNHFISITNEINKNIELLFENNFATVEFYELACNQEACIPVTRNIQLVSETGHVHDVPSIITLPVIPNPPISVGEEPVHVSKPAATSIKESAKNLDSVDLVCDESLHNKEEEEVIIDDDDFVIVASIGPRNVEVDADPKRKHDESLHDGDEIHLRKKPRDIDNDNQTHTNKEPAQRKRRVTRRRIPHIKISELVSAKYLNVGDTVTLNGINGRITNTGITSDNKSYYETPTNWISEVLQEMGALGPKTKRDGWTARVNEKKATLGELREKYIKEIEKYV